MHVNPLLRRTKIAGRRALRRARLLRDNRATVMVEMAFCVPLLVLIGFGGIEISNLTLVNKIGRASCRERVYVLV